MMSNNSENTLPKIGYLYHNPKTEDPTDQYRLDVFISSIPTEQHFDVQRMRVLVKSSQSETECLTITHPWNFETTARVCGGAVVLEDRKEKAEEAFTFGGQLQIDSQENQTVCVLMSPAPILEISGASPLNRLFVEELEIILAERQAKYPDHHRYETLLCEADPSDLYRACLNALIQKFEQFPRKDEKYLQFLKYLYSQERRLSEAGLSKGRVPSLDDIL